MLWLKSRQMNLRMQSSDEIAANSVQIAAVHRTTHMAMPRQSDHPPCTRALPQSECPVPLVWPSVGLVPQARQNDPAETTHQDLTPCPDHSMSLGHVTWSSCDIVTRKSPLALFVKRLERLPFSRSFLSTIDWLFRNLMRYIDQQFHKPSSPGWKNLLRRK